MGIVFVVEIALARGATSRQERMACLLSDAATLRPTAALTQLFVSSLTLQLLNSLALQLINSLSLQLFNTFSLHLLHSLTPSLVNCFASLFGPFAGSEVGLSG